MDGDATPESKWEKITTALDLTNASNITGEKKTYTWDADKKELTLKDEFELEVTNGYGIKVPAETTIYVEGTAKITAPNYGIYFEASDSTVNRIIGVDYSSLEITSWNGIYSMYSLTIENSNVTIQSSYD